MLDSAVLRLRVRFLKSESGCRDARNWTGSLRVSVSSSSDFEWNNECDRM